MSSLNSTVFERVDSDTRKAIILLSQKLIGLQAEITAKLTSYETTQDEVHDAQKRRLSMLENEVERALKSIDEVVSLVVSEELTHSQFLELHQDDLEKFCEMVFLNTEKMTQLNEKL